jgi:hypothetical protein
VRAPAVGEVTVTAGAAVSTVKVVPPVDVEFPRSSAWIAWTVYWPSASAAAVPDHEVPLRVRVSVWTGDPVVVDPAKILTVTVLESPAEFPAVPATDGVLSFERLPAVGEVTETAGAAVSTVKVVPAVDVEFPTSSVWIACTVYWPSASTAAVPDHDPPLRVRLSVCTGVPVGVDPANTFTVTVAESPVALPAAPASEGVLSFVRLPALGVVTVTAGAAVSTTKVVPEVDAELPTSSACTACTV